MIISQIIGGLGNQMFQYAAGRALALRRDTALHLDLSAFAGYHLHHGFELQRIFAAPVAIASAAEVRNILGWQSLPMARRILAKSSLAALRRPGLVVEPHFDYWPGLEHVPQDSYLIGYWQSEKYFRDHSAAIRADFSYQAPLDARNQELAAEIGSVVAVSLHIRRGDYANNPQTFATHGLCPLDYYRAAISYIAERVDDPHFFVFSDDMAWVKENLEIPFPCHFVEHNQGADSHLDMRLMSLCRHHIIANSSFSWWGAWLNPSQAKIVVAPRKWFADGRSVEDLCPPEWVRF